MKSSAFLFLGILIYSCTASAQDKTTEEPRKTVSWADEQVSYNPAKCKSHSDENVYFAIGERVYSLPYKTGISIRGMSAEERAELPIRPAPNEQEGCYGNPMWGNSFSFALKPKALMSYLNSKDPLEHDPPEAAIYVTLVKAKNDRYIAQEMIEHKFKNVKEQYKNCDTWTTDLMACFARIGSENGKVGPEPVAYQSDNKKYSAPNGRSLVITCLGSDSFSGQECKVAYRLKDDISMFYHFDRRVLPARFAIEYDKIVRSEINRLEVKNHLWGQ